MQDNIAKLLERAKARDNLVSLKNSPFENLQNALGLDLTLTLRPFELLVQEDYLDLRKKQNKQWAYQQAVEGIAFAKGSESEKAMKKYNSALELDSDCVEALVGRGCLYANEKKYKFALLDLEEAFEIDPSHPNAKRYLHEIKSIQKQKKLERRKSEKIITSGEFLLPYSKSNVQ